jgi:hypothetical protein
LIIPLIYAEQWRVQSGSEADFDIQIAIRTGVGIIRYPPGEAEIRVLYNLLCQ